MLEDLLKHRLLGTKDEITFILFEVLPLSESQAINKIKKYVKSNRFSIYNSIEGILELLDFVSFVKIKNERISLDFNHFDPNLHNKKLYFETDHFYNIFFQRLFNEGAISKLFSNDGLKFNVERNQYYVLDNEISIKYFSIRNLLISTSFFYRDSRIKNHIWVNKFFNSLLNTSVIQRLNLIERRKSKLSLKRLKHLLKQKEEAGKRAELFVLEFENNRLCGHPNVEQIQLVSENETDAGYDLISFNDIDSIFNNRFIEVKSYEEDVKFYWSKNEIRVAKDLGDKYFLYLVNRSKMHEKSYKPQILRNPFHKVFNSDLWRKEAESWKFTLVD
ncbi:DUF3883 domain-containing protein [Robiginitalea sp. SC105]|uniref:DUF3883 domain-containing protein n=1 Tax=Robiginitalea sp. SC105 TaxID=2762332 RepID=UPI0016396C8F|nr:DUF3883 domain-containing protein [Robiginitalea sp. SC105]MBC2840097.1 DUF3883 domain-containing protein [Robiginitalea sp. SC105]